MNRQTREFCDECWTEFATAATVMRHMEKCIFDETMHSPEENECCNSMLENALVLNPEKFDEKYNKYRSAGVSKKNAVPEAGKCIMKKTNRRFSQFISNFLNTQNIQQFAYVNTAEKHSLELVI